ncbi:MAG: GNAT family N-acetyltransferase [Oscillospiraceae bacterium]|nr:GNAT family N-acetyltransferase [Oscillospiraceae bacterium]
MNMDFNKTDVRIDENTIISLADFSRKQELIDLWSEAFGDYEEFISSFIDSYMIPEYNVPVVISDGKIASAFYLIEFELYSNMQSIGICAYLFAAATKKEYKNRGYMSKLIKYASDLYGNRGVKVIFLFPQNKNLFDYYAKFGFESIYQTKKMTIDSNSLIQTCDVSDLKRFRLQTQNITDVNIFDGLYKSYVEFTAKQSLAPLKDRLFYFKCASSYLESTETKFATFERINSENENNVEIFCYVFYKKYKDTYYIDDIILPEYIKISEGVHKKFDETASVLADYILNILSLGNNSNIEMNVLPSSFSDGKNIKTAMILPLSKDTAEIVKDLKSPVYLNMFFNI